MQLNAILNPEAASGAESDMPKAPKLGNSGTRRQEMPDKREHW